MHVEPVAESRTPDSLLHDIALELQYDFTQCYTVLNNLTLIEPNSNFQLHFPPPSRNNLAQFL